MSSHPPPRNLGSNGPDVVVGSIHFPATYQQWSDYLGLGGDDHITWWTGGVWGGPGNDTIVKDPNAPVWSDVWANYSDYWRDGVLEIPGSPAPIYADLQAGTVSDGWGTTDTLIGIRRISDTGFNDTLLGSQGDDRFNVGNGFDYVDGRGGYDVVQVGGSLATWSIDITSDARNVVMTRIDHETWWKTDTLVNVEAVHFHGSNFDHRFVDLLDFTRVGPDTLIASNLHGWRAGSPGTGASLTYSFMTATPTYGGGSGGTGFTALDASQKQIVRDVLARLSTEVGLSFTEVADVPASFGQLRFGINQQAATKAYSYMPGAIAGNLAGDVWLDVETAQRLSPGQQGHQALLHEIGHALGLSHPLPESDTSGKVVLLERWNDNRYSAMSETDASSSSWRDWFGVLDMQALRHLYGTKPARPGDDVYALDDSIGRVLTTIVDDGGRNVLDVSATSIGATIDLSPRSVSSVGRDANGFGATGNLAFASGTRIHEVIGSAHDDAIFGDESPNLIRPGSGNDFVDGRAGIDTVVFAGPRSDYVLAQGIGNRSVAAADGEGGFNTLVSIERIRFDDTAVAFDLDGAAGNTAKLIGALFGAPYLTQKNFVGIGVTLFDAGLSINQLAELAIGTSVFVGLAGSNSNTDFVRLVYQNVFGQPLQDPGLQAAFVGMLDTGQISQASLAVLAAETDANLASIDLVGLTSTGIEYIAP